MILHYIQTMLNRSDSSPHLDCKNQIVAGFFKLETIQRVRSVCCWSHPWWLTKKVKFKSQKALFFFSYIFGHCCQHQLSG